MKIAERIYLKPEGWTPERNTFVDAEGKEIALPFREALKLGVLLKLKDPSRDHGVLLNSPPIERVRVEHTGVDQAQHFKTQLVESAVRDGWMSIGKGQLTLHTVEDQDDLVYDIVRTPGWYCCHCGQALENANVVPEGSKESLGTQHVKRVHGDKRSPDLNNTSGYERLNYYDCLLDAAQHTRYKSTQPTLADPSVRAALERS